MSICHTSISVTNLAVIIISIKIDKYSVRRLLISRCNRVYLYITLYAFQFLIQNYKLSIGNNYNITSK